MSVLIWVEHDNVSVKDATLQSDFGYIASQPPASRAFRRALEEELDRLRIFLDIP